MFLTFCNLFFLECVHILSHIKQTFIGLLSPGCLFVSCIHVRLGEIHRGFNLTLWHPSAVQISKSVLPNDLTEPLPPEWTLTTHYLPTQVNFNPLFSLKFLHCRTAAKCHRETLLKCFPFQLRDIFFGYEDLDINESYQRKVSSATSELKVCVYLIKACEAILF